MSIRKSIGAVVSSIGLVAGFAGFAAAAPNYSIGTTGPDSSNKVKSVDKRIIHVKNTNKLDVSNYSHQSASSGNAVTEHNTTGGSAGTGMASNANAMSASATIDNAASTAALVAAPATGGGGTSTIATTGPDSVNEISTKVMNKVSVTNDNNINVDNTNCQVAQSGDAEVSGNTTGGSATTGNASNTNTSTLTFKVSN